MKIEILIFLVIGILIFYIISAKTVKLVYMKTFVMALACIVFVLCLIFFSQTAVISARNGIQLWFNIVFPSLFPFFVVSELLYKTGIVKVLGILLEPLMRPLFNVPGCGSFPFAMGITSGYPVGAKLTVNMRQENLLTKVEAERLLAFSNNSGPLFILGAVAIGMFQMSHLGLFLLCCHIAACITVGLIFRFYRKGKDGRKATNKHNIFSKLRTELSKCVLDSKSNFGSILGEAIKNSITMLLMIGGFIIFFSVIINLLLEIGFIHALSVFVSTLLSPLGVHEKIIPAVISGFFEITTGTNMASKASDAPFIQQLTATSMIIGWAGLSVHTQVYSIVSSTDVSMKPYLLGKFIQGFIAGIYTFIIIKIAGPAFLGARPAFHSNHSILGNHWQDYFLSSCQNMFICIIILMILSFIALLLNKLIRLR